MLNPFRYSFVKKHYSILHSCQLLTKMPRKPSMRLNGERPKDETNIKHVLAKFDAYCELHRLYTSVTDLTIANWGPARTSQRISQS